MNEKCVQFLFWTLKCKCINNLQESKKKGLKPDQVMQNVPLVLEGLGLYSR